MATAGAWPQIGSYTMQILAVVQHSGLSQYSPHSPHFGGTHQQVRVYGSDGSARTLAVRLLLRSYC